MIGSSYLAFACKGCFGGRMEKTVLPCLFGAAYKCALLNDKRPDDDSGCSDMYLEGSSDVVEAMSINMVVPNVFSQSPLILACLKYFIPTHALTTHTQAITQVKIIKQG